jgi:F0F1-type ATP synthase gamma subunit
MMKMRKQIFYSVEEVKSATDKQIDEAWQAWQMYEYEPDEEILDEICKQYSDRGL